MIETIKQNSRQIAIALAVAALIVIVGILLGRDEQPEEIVETGQTTTVPGITTMSTSSLSPDARATDVPAINCAPLITLEEVDEALGVVGQLASMILYTDGEACWRELADDGDFFARIEPGDLGDFEPGSRLIGVTGEPVSGVGEIALWFGGEGAEGGGAVGVLSVGQNTPLGALVFRIRIGRPDVDSSVQREAAKTLALTVLPRFQGVEESDPVDANFGAAFEEEEAGRADASFVDNLLVKEEAGEWTRGEGLVATLRLFADEADATDVLRHPDVLNREGTGVVSMAREYLEDGADGDAKAEINRLLDLIVFSNDRLEAMAGIGPDADVETSRVVAMRVALPVSQPTVQQLATDCQDFFHEDVYGAAPAGPCLEWRPANVSADLEGEYRVFIPAPSLPQGGWTEDHYDLALTALEHSARWYESEGRPLALAAGAAGKMSSVNLVFAITGGGGNLAIAAPVAGKVCGVALFRSMQQLSADDFEQTIAHELAHCFQTENFPGQNKVGYRIVKWREEGLADHLSNVVYPQNNQEWDSLWETAKLKRNVTVMDLAYGNFLFFQYLENQVGLSGVFDLVARLPTSGGKAEQEKSLAGFPGMTMMFQEYAEAMIDGEIADTGGGRVPYKMKYPSIAISGTGSVTVEIKPFGLSRAQFTVEECKIARLDLDKEAAEASARPEAGQGWEIYPTRLPADSSDAHDRITAITTTQEEDFTVEVTEFKDDPECEEEEDPSDDCEIDLCGSSDYYRSGRGPWP